MTQITVAPIVQRVTIEDAGTAVEVKTIKQNVDVQDVGVQGAKGDQGAQGVPGPNQIGGYVIEITTPQAGDLLQFNAGSKWVNSPQANITDGGNF